MLQQLELKYVITCDDAIISDNNKLSLIGIFDEIRAVNIPAIHPALTVISTIDGPIGTHKENIELINLKDNKIVASAEQQDAVISDKGGNTQISKFNNILFLNEGIYWIKVIVDGQVLTRKESHYVTVSKI